MTSISILSSASRLTAYCLTHMVITVKMVHALNTINDLTFEPKYINVHVGPYFSEVMLYKMFCNTSVQLQAIVDTK